MPPRSNACWPSQQALHADPGSFSATFGSRGLARCARSRHLVRPTRSRLPLAGRAAGAPLTGLTCDDGTLGIGAHVHVIGKGRKERCVPLAKPTVAVLKAWLREPPCGDRQILFPHARGTRLSPDGVHYLLVKHVKAAAHVGVERKTRHRPSLAPHHGPRPAAR